MILAVVLGLLIGLTLGALGGGGSILAVPVLAHLAGQDAAAATATSLVAVGVASAVGAAGHARAGHVRWGGAAVMVATGVPGSWAGSRASAAIDGDVLLLAFSALVLVAAHRMLTACPSCTNEGERAAVAADGQPSTDPEPDGAAAAPSTATVTLDRTVAATGAPPAPSTHRSGLAVIAAGTVVGFTTGLFGVGGGFVIVPALTLALGLTMRAAIATSLAVIVGNAAVALGFRGLASVDWEVAGPFTATMLLGSLVGTVVASRLPARRSLHAFAVVLVLVAVANAVAAGASLWG